MVEGIDVSSFQGNIDWPRVRAAGIRFAYCRASLGVSSDGKYTSYITGAQNAGLLTGAYHVFRPNVTASSQAKWFQVMMGDVPLPPALDCELHGEYSATEYSKRLALFVQEVEAATGRKVILYTYPWFWKTYAEGGTSEDMAVLRERDLWIANYKAKTPQVPKTWEEWTIWQYAGNDGTCPGVPTACDRDRFNGTEEEFEAWVAAY